MPANDSRPVNLDLMKFHFPITAWASILHRVCAVITWVGLGYMLYLLHAATQTPQSYVDVQVMLADSFIMQFITWGFLTALGYYCMGGIKHLIQEFGYFEDFSGGQAISWTAIGLGILISVLVGVAIWA